MSTSTVADYLLDRLREWGVDMVFGYPGDGINGLLAAWGRADNQPRFVQARHEEMAAFEAVGYAKFTGRVGVCAATSGPGAIHLLNGLYDAKLDHVPVVAIVGQTNRSAMGGSYQQEVDLLSLFKDVASDYVQMVTVPEQLPNVLDRAIRTATARRAPTAIVLPADVQELDVRRAHARVQDGALQPGHAAGRRSCADAAAVRRAAEVLNAGQQGRHAGRVGRPRARPRRSSRSPTCSAPAWPRRCWARTCCPTSCPGSPGSIGLLGTRPSYEMMMGCDTLLTVGSSFPYTQFLPEFDQARAVQIDIDPGLIGMRYPYEVNLVGDAASTLRALIPLLERKADRSWREGIEADVARWWETMAMEAAVEADPDQPDAAVRGAVRAAARRRDRHRRLRLGGQLVRAPAAVPRPDARLAVGEPGHDGPGGALRDRRQVRLPGPAGDRLRRRRRDADERPGRADHDQVGTGSEWADPRLVVAVLHNNDLNQVTWEMRAMAGAPKFAESQRLPDVDYAGFAASLGLAGNHGGQARDIGPAWDRALAADRPTVLDVRCDPDVPPIPPHATFEQMKDAAKAMLAGDEDRWGVLKRGVETKLQEFLPHRER